MINTKYIIDTLSRRISEINCSEIEVSLIDSDRKNPEFIGFKIVKPNSGTLCPNIISKVILEKQTLFVRRISSGIYESSDLIIDINCKLSDSLRYIIYGRVDKNGLTNLDFKENLRDEAIKGGGIFNVPTIFGNIIP